MIVTRWSCYGGPSLERYAQRDNLYSNPMVSSEERKFQKDETHSRREGSWRIKCPAQFIQHFGYERLLYLSSCSICPSKNAIKNNKGLIIVSILLLEKHETENLIMIYACEQFLPWDLNQTITSYLFNFDTNAQALV